MNLLVALDALLTERHVTRAGQRVGLSQPAMSHALARLRELLDDQVLIRSPSGMRPTARAAALAPVLRSHLDSLRRELFAQDSFDPSSEGIRFTIATSDYGSAVIAPPLIRRLRETAPSIALRLRPLPSRVPLQHLADGVLDLVVGTFGSIPPEVPHEVLFEERFVCLRSLGRSQEPLTAERFADMGHVLVTSPGEGPGPVDSALAKLGLQRRIAVYVAHFLAAPAIIAATDLIVTLPERVALPAAQVHPLECTEPPVALAPFPVTMIWHQRTERNAAFQWLRDQVRTAVAAAPPRATSKERGSR